MSGDVYAQSAQLLDQPPNFRAAGRNFVGDLGATHNDRRVFHQQANNAAEAKIGGAKLREIAIGCPGLIRAMFGV